MNGNGTTRYGVYRSSKILAIDLGGSTARAAVMEGGEPVLIPNRRGGFGRPCAVGVRDGRVVLCEEALRQAVSRPDDTTVSWKRNFLTGTKVAIGEKAYSPELAAAIVLRKLRQDAADYLGEDPISAIITVPNSYTLAQRQTVMDAGRIAGLNVDRLINNTSAAALDCGLLQGSECCVLLCDLGSTSFDVSLMALGDGVAETIASAGDARLGGDDFTECIVNWMEHEIIQSSGIDLSADSAASARLREAAETAKKELSFVLTTQIFIPCIAVKDGQPLHFDQTLTRTKFNELTAALRERACDVIQDVLTADDFFSSKIEKILFVGGGSRMPAMRDTVRQLLGKDIIAPQHCEECIARGAAIQAGIITGYVHDALLLEATTHTLGIETAGGVCTKLIARNTTYPIRVTKSFTTSADDQATVDIRLLEGEREKASENETVGRFQITGIPPAAKGVPYFDVSFTIEGNGILSVYAKDTATGADRELKPRGRRALSEELIRSGEALVDQIVAAWEE